MPISLRFVVPLALALAAIAWAVQPLVDRLTFQWFVRDLDVRGELIAKTAQEPLVELMRERKVARERVVRYFERILQGERVSHWASAIRPASSPTRPRRSRAR